MNMKRKPIVLALLGIGILTVVCIGAILHGLLAIGTRIMTGKWDW